MSSMKCPNCGKQKIWNLDTEETSDGRVRRRKHCKVCGYRFTTYESYIPDDIPVEERPLYFVNVCKRRKIVRKGEESTTTHLKVRGL